MMMQLAAVMMMLAGDWELLGLIFDQMAKDNVQAFKH
jgi:hypothetical protein